MQHVFMVNIETGIDEVALEWNHGVITGGADKSLARPGRKQTAATEDFEFHISYL